MTKRDDKIWNEAIERAVDVACGFPAAMNGASMAPFAHDERIASAVIARDIEIGRAIRQLKRVQP